jgi:hypothetical protein
MRQTIGDVTFELPDDMMNRGEYDYHRGDPDTEVDVESIMVDLAKTDRSDAESALADARSRLQGLGRTFSPATFVRGDGSSVPAFTGEVQLVQPPPVKLVVAAIVTPRTTVIASYWAPAGKDALGFFRQVMAGTFVAGEQGADPRSVPQGWTRRQAGAVRFALPRDWVDPKSFLFGFGSGVEIRTLLSEPVVPEGTMDWSADLHSENPETVTRLGTEPVTGPGLSGWTGEWRLSGGALQPGDEKTIRKMSVTVAGKTAFTAYARVSSPRPEYLERLEEAWRSLRCSLRAATPTDG